MYSHLTDVQIFHVDSIDSTICRTSMLHVQKEEEEEEKMKYYFTFPINLIKIEPTRNEIAHLPDMHVELFIHFIHSIGNWRLF